MGIRCRRALVSLFASLLVAVAGNASDAPLPERDVDHYKFWEVQPLKYERTVILKGQFDDKPREWALGPIQFIGNPVIKNDERPRDERTHYVAYGIRGKKTPEPPRVVNVSNQLHRKGVAWRINEPAYLLVPAGKAIFPGLPGKPAPGADHYLCYIVREMPAVEKIVVLQDQFDRLLEKKEKLEMLQPEYFCVPVEKTVDGKKSPIHNGRVHLAIYRIAPTELKKPITVNTTDQLRDWTLTVKTSRLLAVPSLKLNWKPDPDDDHPSAKKH